MPPEYQAVLATAWNNHLTPRAADAPGCISLFAGGGGSALGFSMAGFRPLLVAEQDANAVACLRANFQDAAVFSGDIRNLDAAHALELCSKQRGELDMIGASPPCQGFSSAGPRRASDPRNSLVMEFVRLVDGIKPKAFVMENVEGILRQGAGRALFKETAAALGASGYALCAWVLDAAYFHVPQHRRRLFLAGVRRDISQRPPEPPEPLSWPWPLSAAIADFPREQAPELGHVWVDESPAGRNTRTWHLAAAAPQGAVYAGHQRRMRWYQPCATLTASAANGRDKRPYLRSMHCHPLQTRTFSPAELGRIASFPDQYRFPGEWHRAVSRIGNAVPPLLMRSVAQSLRQVMEQGARHA